MVKVEQTTLNLIPEGTKVVFFEQGEHRVYMEAYPIIKCFDGVVCNFQFLEGGSWFTTIPISTGSLSSKKAATLTIMNNWVEYKITDDCGSIGYLYIRTSETDIIFKSIIAYKEVYGIIALLK
tara:strand:+ start:731 stop:1099 length:369 start_codon:yes stop_codon:yes gene_type:complete